MNKKTIVICALLLTLVLTIPATLIVAESNGEESNAPDSIDLSYIYKNIPELKAGDELGIECELTESNIYNAIKESISILDLQDATYDNDTIERIIEAISTNGTLNDALSTILTDKDLTFGIDNENTSIIMMAKVIESQDSLILSIEYSFSVSMDITETYLISEDSTHIDFPENTTPTDDITITINAYGSTEIFFANDSLPYKIVSQNICDMSTSTESNYYLIWTSENDNNSWISIANYYYGTESNDSDYKQELYLSTEANIFSIDDVENILNNVDLNKNLELSIDLASISTYNDDTSEIGYVSNKNIDLDMWIDIISNYVEYNYGNILKSDVMEGLLDDLSDDWNLDYNSIMTIYQIVDPDWNLERPNEAEYYSGSVPTESDYREIGSDLLKYLKNYSTWYYSFDNDVINNNNKSTVSNALNYIKDQLEISDFTKYNATGIEGTFNYEVVDDSVSITKGIFNDSNNLIPSSINEKTVTEIGSDAFSNNYLQTITLPSSIKVINSSAFSYCTSLNSITILDDSKLEYIGDYAFANCCELETIILPSSLITISSYAFSYCTSLNSITILDDSKLEYIGDYAFAYCSNDLQIPIFNYNVDVSSTAFIGITEGYVGDFESDKFVYSVWKGEQYIVKLTRYIGSDTAVDLIIGNENIDIDEIHLHLEGGNYQLMISPNVFSYFTEIESVKICSNVIKIGERAFEGCTYLKTLTIDSDSQLDAIGEYAFNNCYNLTISGSLDSVSNISLWAFSGIQNYVGPGNYYNTIVQDNENNNINYTSCNLFKENGTLKARVGINVLNGIDKLEISNTIKIENTEYIIAGITYLNCYPIENLYMDVTIPKFVEYIELQSCSCIDNLVFANESQLTELNCYSFACSSIKTVDFGDNSSLQYIDYGAFQGCTSLATVDFGDNSSLQYIYDNAFQGCTSLESMYIPASIESISGSAFSNCASLKEFTINPNNEFFCVDTGIIYSIDKSTLVAYPNGADTKNYSIPDCVIFISDGVCIGSDQLESLHIGKELQSGIFSLFRWVSVDIDKDNHCFKIENGSLVADNTLLFYSGNETGLIISDDIHSIGPSAFNCSIDLESITISANVNHIDKNTFTNCSNLKYLLFKDSSKLEYIHDNAFQGCTSLITVDFGDNSSLQYICSNAFQGCISLTTVDFGDNSSLQYIYNNAFQDCTSLTTVDFGDNSSLKYIGPYTFKGCTSLNSINYPNDIDTVFANSFEETLLHDNYYNVESGNFKYELNIEDNIGYAIATSYIGSDSIIDVPENVEINNREYIVNGFQCNLDTTITKICIGGNITNISYWTLLNYSSLECIDVDESNDNYISSDGVLFDSNGNILCYPNGKTSSAYILPEYAKSFHGNSYLRVVVLEEGTELGQDYAKIFYPIGATADEVEIGNDRLEITISRPGYTTTEVGVGGINESNETAIVIVDISTSSDQHIYATFILNECPVEFNENYETGNVTETSALYNSMVELPYPSIREGYTFNGWIYNDTIYPAGSYVLISNDSRTIFEADWTKMCDVVISTYEHVTVFINGESVPSEGQTYNFDEGTEITINIYANNNYNFENLRINGNIYSPFVQYANLYVYSIIVPSYNIQIDLNVEPDQYDIRYFTTWQAIDGLQSSYSYGTGLDLQDPVRIGYTFEGWYGDLSLSGDKIETIDASTSGNVILYAKWIQNTYTVKWMNNGTTLETDTGLIAGTIPTYDGAIPTKASDDMYTYTFIRWNPDVTAVTKDVTYVATFSATDRTQQTTIKVTGVSLNNTYLYMDVDEVQHLAATVHPTDATNISMIWSSSDSSIVSVNNGIITAKELGNAVVTVTTVDGNFTASCSVTVSGSEIEIIDNGTKTTTHENTDSSEIITVVEETSIKDVDKTIITIKENKVETDKSGNVISTEESEKTETVSKELTIVVENKKTIDENGTETVMSSQIDKTDTKVKESITETIKNSAGKMTESTISTTITDTDSGMKSTAEITSDQYGNTSVTSNTQITVEETDEGVFEIDNNLISIAIEHSNELSEELNKEDKKVTHVINIAAQGDDMAHVVVSTEALEAVKEAGTEIKISSNVGSVQMSTNVLETLSEVEGSSVSISIGKANISELTVEQLHAVGDSEVFELSASSGLKDFHELNGLVTVTLNYELKDGENPDHITVWYVNNDGELSRKNTTYDPLTQTVSFQTDHFSYYFVGSYSSETTSVLTYIVIGIVIAALAAVAIAVYMKKKSTSL